MYGALGSVPNHLIIDMDTMPLSLMTGLEQLRMSGSMNITGNLANLDLTNCDNLITLYCNSIALSGNVEDLDLTGCASLKEFNFYALPNIVGDFSQINLTQCPVFEFLSFQSMPVGGTIGIDLTQNPLLKHLNFPYTQIGGNIEDLDITNNPLIYRIYIANSSNIAGDIAQWDLTNSTALTILHFGGTHIAGDVGLWDLTNCVEMLDLNIGALCTGDITALDITTMTKLTKFGCGYANFTGDIADFDLSNNTSLTYFGVMNCQVSGNIQDLILPATIKQCYVMNCPNVAGDIAQWDISHCTDFLLLQANGTPNIGGDFANFDITNNTKFTTIRLDNLNLTGDVTQLDISHQPNLSYFNLNGNNLTGDITLLDTSNNLALTGFDFGGNNITGDIANLDITHLVNFNHIYIENTNMSGDIAQFDITQNIKLTTLACDNITNLTGDFADFNFSNNTILRVMYFRNTAINYTHIGGSFTTYNVVGANLRFQNNNFTATMTDNILVDMATSGSNGYVIEIDGNNAAPSAVGDAAIVTLTTAPLSWACQVTA